jgi:hypothetical protein
VFATELTVIYIVANAATRGDNQLVPNIQENDATGSDKDLPFASGTMVVATLGNPREKFWGVILTLAAAGLSICGVELASFDDLISLVQQDEPFSPSVVFFPMHRIERIELDLPDGDIPSLSQRFASKTKLEAAAVLMQHSNTKSAPVVSDYEGGE